MRYCKGDGILFAGKHRIRVAVLPFAPLIQKLLDLIYVVSVYRLDLGQTGLLEFVQLVPDGEISFSGQLCQIGC